MNKRTLGIFFILFFIVHEMTAQALFPRFRYYTSDEGLFTNMIHYITQDEKGYMWFGTYNGVSRYDSYKFINYNQIDSIDSIPTRITAINNINGQLWVASSGYIYSYNYLTKQFQRVNPDLENLESIHSIANNDKGLVWIASSSKGIWRYDLDKKKISKHHELKNIRVVISHLSQDIYAVSDDGAIYFLEKSTQIFREIYNFHLERRSITCAHIDKYGNIWLGDWHNGIYCYRQSSKDHIHYPLLTRGRPIQRIGSILEYDHKYMMVGSDEGITLVDKNSGNHFTISDNDQTNKSLVLNNRFVYSLFKDKDENIWSGTYFGGVNFLSKNRNDFKTLPREKSNSIKMGRVISKFTEDKYGMIWIATDDGGLYQFNPQNNSCKRVRIGGKNEPLNIHALLSVDNILWVGTYESGLFKYNIDNGHIQHLANIQNVYAIEKDANDNIWFGTPTGLMFKAKNYNEITRISDASEFYFIDQLEADNKNNLWISSDKGLSSVDINTKKITHYNQQLKQLINKLVDIRAIHYQDNKIWMGTQEDGIILFDIKTKKMSKDIIPATRINKSSIQFITSIKNTLWISTFSGLYQYNTLTKTLNHFNKDDGLETERFNPNAGLKTSKDIIYIGGYRGFNYFDPQKIAETETFPSVSFTDFHLANQTSQNKDPELSEHIVLKHNQPIFNIDFSSMYYSSPHKIRYRYILDGFDKDFIETNQGTAMYTNVPPGDYTFKVVANSSFGEWGENYNTLKITILPPWWKSNIMRAFYVFFLICVGILFFYQQKKLLKKRNEEQIRRINQENEQKIIESKLDFFANTAHEIRTPATLIAAPIEVILESNRLPNDIMEDMQIIKKNSDKLVELINQVLDFRNVEHGYGQTNYSSENVFDFISEQLIQYKIYCENHRIHVRIYSNEKEHLIGLIDKDIVSKIFNSLMSNALKYTKDLIEILIDKTDNGFIISVFDNGKGIPTKNYSKIFEPFFTTSNIDSPSKGFGIGLSMVSKLLEAIDGEIEIDSQENIYTRFTVTIPFGIREDLNKDNSENPDSSILEHVETLELSNFEDHTKILLKNNIIETILIVDDDDEIVEYLSKQIGKRYNVIHTNNGQKALDILGQNKIDIIVSDVSMGVMNGFELCKRIKEDIKLCHIPIILLTGQTDNKSKIEGITSGADVYLVKPVSISFLYAQICGMLEKRKQLITSLNSNPQTILQSLVENDEDKKFISRIEELIFNNLSNTEFSVDDLAKQMYVSRSSLYTKLNAISDLTPNEFIRLIRLRKAAQYIIEGKYKINEICYLVGFSSPSYFTRSFTKQFGISPKDYRPMS